MTVAEILAALRARPSVSFFEQDGQLIANDASTTAHYVFAAKGSAPFPAVAMIYLYQVDKSILFRSNVICQAQTAPCDQFARDTAAAVNRLSQQLNATAAKQPGYIGH